MKWIVSSSGVTCAVYDSHCRIVVFVRRVVALVTS